MPSPKPSTAPKSTKAPSLKQRAARSKAGVRRVVRTDVPAFLILPLIAQHRRARERWDDSLIPADKAWRERHGRDTSPEVIAAAEAERDAADAAVTVAWNALFSTPPTTSAELLALLRHVQHYIKEDHDAEDAISLNEVVCAIGDAVEHLRAGSQTSPAASFTARLPDSFLIDLAPMLLPLLNEADVEWAKARALYKRAEEMCGPGPGHGSSEADRQAYIDRFDAALIATGYSAVAEANRPLFERLEAIVGPLMNVPVQTLEGLILKQRIGQTLEHYADDAACDLDKLAKAYKFGNPAPQPIPGQAMPSVEFGLSDRVDFASATLPELITLYDKARLISDVAHAASWQGCCQVRGQHNAAGDFMHWLGDALTDVESFAADEIQRRHPVSLDGRKTRLAAVAERIIFNGDDDETANFVRELATFAAEQAKD